MSAPRLRRLAADYESVRSEFSGHPHVVVEPLGPMRPPEAYRVTLRVRGLVLDGDNPVPVDEHRIEIRLPLSYPREQPVCTPLTPLFHPNVRDYYCIADYWAAGQSLVDTIAKLADMIQYRVYNPRSPLNALAARWAAQNPQIFPLGNVTLGAPEIEIALRPTQSIRAVPTELSDAPPPAPAEPLPPTEPLEVVERAGDEDDELLISIRGSGR